MISAPSNPYDGEHTNIENAQVRVQLLPVDYNGLRLRAKGAL